VAGWEEEDPAALSLDEGGDCVLLACDGVTAGCSWLVVVFAVDGGADIVWDADGWNFFYYPAVVRDGKGGFDM
jgi:hypothetical protein